MRNFIAGLLVCAALSAAVAYADYDHQWLVAVRASIDAQARATNAQTEALKEQVKATRELAAALRQKCGG